MCAEISFIPYWHCIINHQAPKSGLKCILNFNNDNMLPNLIKIGLYIAFLLGNVPTITHLIKPSKFKLGNWNWRH
jgi:hypothetical protein